MTDLFTSMRRTDNRVDVDPSFRADLLTAVRERLADAAPGTDDWIDVPLVLVDSDDEQLVGQQRRPAWALIAAAAVVAVVGVAGFALAINNDDNDQSPAPVATVSVAPTTTVATETVSRAVANANDIPVTFTVPKSWTVLTHEGAVVARPMGGAVLNLTHADVQFDGVTNIYSGGCMRPLHPSVGPTVDDLVTAWTNVPELAATAPVDITVDGYTGKQIELTVPDDACRKGFDEFGVWSSGEPNTDQRAVFPSNQPVSPKQHFQMLVLDVDGTRLLIAASTHPNTPPEERAALEELLASIQIG